MFIAELTTYGQSIASSLVTIDGVILISEYVSNIGTADISQAVLDIEACGSINKSIGSVRILDSSSNTYSVRTILFYVNSGSSKLVVAGYSQEESFILKTAGVLNVLLPFDFSSFTNGFAFSLVQSGYSNAANNTDGVLHIENPDTTADDSYSVYSKTQVDSLLSDVTYTAGEGISLANNIVKTTGIPFGIVDDTSTSTVFTVTVPGVYKLEDGVCCLVKNGVVTSASGFTLNVNGLGAKPCYSNMAAATRETTIFNVNYTMLFVYDSTRVEDGAWICYRGYFSDANSIAYQIRGNVHTLPTTAKFYRYRLLFTSADGTHFVPSNISTSTNATAKRDVVQTPIDPFGEIVYYSTTAAVDAEANPGPTYLWTQYAVTLGYSFNRTGATLVLDSFKPLYIKCAPQSNGSAIIDADNPYVQTLPNTADGKIYIFLGITSSATTVELLNNHPVYYHDGTAIRLWHGKDSYSKIEIDTIIGDYVPTSRTVNSKPLTSDITLTLDDVADGTNRAIPTVNNSTITIKKNTNDTGDSFTTNAASGKTINLGLSTVATSGSYNDLSNKPTIPTVNDSTITIKKNSDDTGDSFTTNAASGKTINLGLSSVATSGSYNDLSNKPTIPTVNNAKLTIKKNTDDTGTEFTANASTDVTCNLGLASVATSGSYNDLSNKPTIPTVNNASLTINKGGTDDTGSKTFTANASSNVTINLGLATVASSGSYNDLSNKPTIPTVNNAKLTIKKNSSDTGTEFTANASTDVTCNLGLSTVASSGSYNDLSNKPTIPTVNDTTITIKKNTSDAGDSFTTNAATAKTINLGLATVATSGSYNDLSNKPSIPTKTSDLTNDSDFITATDIPSDVSAFNNDAGYLTSYTETDPTVPAWAKEQTKPSYTLDEVSDGSNRKLSDYVPTTRKVNNKALSSDVTLSLDDVADGSTRKLANYIPYNEINSTINGFDSRKLWEYEVHNTMWAADKRYDVTRTGFSAGSNASLFNGSFEDQNKVAAGGTGVILIAGKNGTKMFGGGYPYGYLEVAFYYTSVPESVTCRVYSDWTQNPGWHAVTLTNVDKTANQALYRGLNSSFYGVTQIEITINAKSDKEASVTEIAFYQTRGTLQQMAVFNKAVAQTLYNDLEGPKFKTTGGTSSQFVKGDGTLDSTSYAAASAIPTKTSQLTNDSGFLTSHQSLAGVVASAQYNATDKTIEFYNSDGTKLNTDIDASAFIKDGMVDTVSVTNGKLVITFNTDSGKSDIEIPITDIFDASNYYTKTEIDNAGYLTSSDLSGYVQKVSSTDNAITRFDGTSGAVQNSGVLIDDSNNLLIPLGSSGTFSQNSKLVIGNAWFGSNTTGGLAYGVKSGSTYTGYYTFESTAFRPVSSSDNAIDIGTSSYRWKNLYIAGKICKNGTYQITIPSATGTMALTSDIPTNVSAFTNDANYLTSSDLTSYELKSNLKEGAYLDVDETTTTSTSTNLTTGKSMAAYVSSVLPTVNNATLTIQKNGTTVNTFTANASSNVTANITVPTTVAELTDAEDYVTTEDLETDVQEYLEAHQNSLVAGNNITIISSSSILPSEYSQVEYIQSSGASYLDTGLVPTDSTKIIVDIFNNSTGSFYVIGARATSSSAILLAQSGSSTGSVLSGTFNGSSITAKTGSTNWTRTSSGQRYVITLETSSGTGYYTVEDLTNEREFNGSTSYTAIGTVSTHILLCAFNSSNVLGGTTRVYRCEIYQNDLLAFQGIPCYRNSDGRYGLYDTVSSTFIVSSSSTHFTGSTEIHDVLTISSKDEKAQWGKITGTLSNQTDLDNALSAKANSADLASVATSGSYNDLSNKPTIPTVNNSTITIKKNSNDTGDSFTTNASSGKTINLGLSTVATSGSYNDLSNKPTIPTVNNASLTINKGGTDDTGSKTFTANASSDVTINLGLSTVASSGSYNDLSNKPTIPTVNNSTITIKKNTNDTGDSFTTNASSGKTINLGLATVATSGSYNDLSNKPTIPTVNNATLTIQKNGTNVNTFTANASSNVTANITVPLESISVDSTAQTITNGNVDLHIPADITSYEVLGSFYRNNVSGSGNISIPAANCKGLFPAMPTAGTYKVRVQMYSSTASYTLNVSYGSGNSYSLTSSGGIIDDERTLTVAAGSSWSATLASSVGASTVIIVRIYKTSSSVVTEVGAAAVSNSYFDLDDIPAGVSYFTNDANYVTSSRKINNKALSSDITLTLDDVADGSTRAIPTKTTARSDGNYLYNGQTVDAMFGNFGISSSANLLNTSGVTSYVAVRADASNPLIGLKCGSNLWYCQASQDKFYFGPTSAKALMMDQNGNGTFRAGTCTATGFVYQNGSTAGTNSDVLLADGSISQLKTVNNESIFGSGNISVSGGSTYTAGSGIAIDTTDDTISATGIPFGIVDGTSTSTAFTATVPGIDRLEDGVCCMLKNGVVTSASTGFTIDINNLGAKPVYSNMAAATAETTMFNVNYTMLFIYDSTRVEDGCWILYRGYYQSDTDKNAYQIRLGTAVLPASDTSRYYKLFFTSADGTSLVPASVNSSNNVTTARTPNQRAINPFGRIAYTSATTNYTTGTSVAAASLWDQYVFNLAYSYGPATPALTPKLPVYIKCTPQSDGSAKVNSTTPVVQALPQTADGSIYIFIGIAYYNEKSQTMVELMLEKPVYYHDGTGIRLWPGTSFVTINSDQTITSNKTLQYGKKLYLGSAYSYIAGSSNSGSIHICAFLSTNSSFYTEFNVTNNGLTLTKHSGTSEAPVTKKLVDLSYTLDADKLQMWTTLLMKGSVLEFGDTSSNSTIYFKIRSVDRTQNSQTVKDTYLDVQGDGRLSVSYGNNIKCYVDTDGVTIDGSKTLTFNGAQTSYSTSLQNDNFTSTLKMTGVFAPSTTETYTLGTSSLKWSNIYSTTFTGNLTGDVTGKFATARNINGLAFDGSADIQNFAQCTTEGNVAEKTATITGLTVSNGIDIYIHFGASNTATDPTLNINDTTAYPIYFGANKAGTTQESSWYSGEIVHFVFFTMGGGRWYAIGRSHAVFGYDTFGYNIAQGYPYNMYTAKSSGARHVVNATSPSSTNTAMMLTMWSKTEDRKNFCGISNIIASTIWGVSATGYGDSYSSVSRTTSTTGVGKGGIGAVRQMILHRTGTQSAMAMGTIISDGNSLSYGSVSFNSQGVPTLYRDQNTTVDGTWVTLSAIPSQTATTLYLIIAVRIA